MIEVQFAAPHLPAAGALALLVSEGGLSGGLWAAIDEASGGQAGRAAVAAKFTGKKAQTATLLAPTANISRVVLVGLGAEPLTPRMIEEAGGTAAHLMAQDAAGAIGSLSGDIDMAHAALGAALRSYRFDIYRTKQKPEDKPALSGVTIYSADPVASEALWRRHAPVVEGAFFTRDLVTEPANILTPAEMAIRAAKLAELGLAIEVLGQDELTALKFGALLGVAQGSRQPPRVVIMRWNGADAETTPLLFVGKGVTFDTGGISLKDPPSMDEMKFDMCGAATVLAAIDFAARSQLRINLVGLVPTCENMPDGRAVKPGDIVTSASGQTVEILNTDAEGRLILCDALNYARRYKPEAVVDFATLTGACIIALGHIHSGVMGNDDALARELIEAGVRTDDRAWQLPLTEEYGEGLRSNFADMANIAGREGGAITAAAFLGKFTQGLRWAHMDIAGSAWAGGAAKGATGRPLSLVTDFLTRRAARSRS